MITRRDPFQAIADPTRRRIIGMVAEKPLNVNTIAESFAISRQAISLHIKVLIECELIKINKQGREVLRGPTGSFGRDISLVSAIQEALGNQTG